MKKAFNNDWEDVVIIPEIYLEPEEAIYLQNIQGDFEAAYVEVLLTAGCVREYVKVTTPTKSGAAKIRDYRNRRRDQLWWSGEGLEILQALA